MAHNIKVLPEEIMAHVGFAMLPQRVGVPGKINTGEDIIIVNAGGNLLQNPIIASAKAVLAPHLQDIQIGIANQEIMGLR